MLTHVVLRDHLLSFLGFSFVRTLVSLKKVVLCSFQIVSFLVRFATSTIRLVFLALGSSARSSIGFRGCQGLAGFRDSGACSCI